MRAIYNGIYRNRSSSNKKKLNLPQLIGDAVWLIMSLVVIPLLIGIIGSDKDNIKRESELNALYDEAKELNEENRFSEALYKWENLINIEDNSDRYHRGYGYALMQLQRYDEAIEQYNAAIEINATATDFSCIGWINEQKGDTEAAYEMYKHAHELEPGVVKYMLNMGITLKELGKYKEALDILEENILALDAAIYSNDNERYKSYYNYGIALDKNGLYNEALLQFETAQKYSTGNLLASQMIDVEKARIELTDNPNDPYLHNRLGNKLYYAGLYDEAYSEFNCAMELGSDKVFYYNISVTAYYSGKYEEALRWLEWALEKDPNYIAAMVERNLFIAEQAYENDKDNDEKLFSLGIAYIDRGKYSDAKDLFSEFIKNNPENVEGREYLELISSLQESDDLADINEKAILAEKLFNKKIYAKSEELYRWLLTQEVSDESKAFYYNHVGCIYYEYWTRYSYTGYLDSAKEYFEEAAKLDPTEPVYKENVEKMQL